VSHEQQQQIREALHGIVVLYRDAADRLVGYLSQFNIFSFSHNLFVLDFLFSFWYIMVITIMCFSYFLEHANKGKSSEFYTINVWYIGTSYEETEEQIIIKPRKKTNHY